MELTLDLVYNAQLVIKKVTGTYPHTDNCYECEVIYEAEPARNFTAQYVPMPVLDMWKLLQIIKDNVQGKHIVQLIDTFNRYGEHMYKEASDVSAEDAAKTDI